MTDVKHAAFIADCGRGAGLGHLSRTLVLAQAFVRAGFKVKGFVTDEACEGLVRSSGLEAQHWTGDIPSASPPPAVAIIDGYRFDGSLSGRLKETWGCKVIAIDDLAEAPIRTDIVLNHNLYGSDLDYSSYRAARFLTGPRYALISRDFLALKDGARSSPPRTIVNFGSLDDGRYAWPLIKELDHSQSGIVIDAVVPALAEPYEDHLRSLSGRLNVHRHVDMARFMEGASIYVGAAGVTVMEALAAGLDVVVCATAANQRYNIRKLEALGHPAFEDFDAGPMALAVRRILERARASSTNEIDALGSDRVVAETLRLLALSASETLGGA